MYQASECVTAYVRNNLERIHVIAVFIFYTSHVSPSESDELVCGKTEQGCCITNKKLSCCCDCRSYACKFAVRTPLRVHCSRHSAVSAHVSAVAPNGTVPTGGRTNAVSCVLGLRCASFFVVRFMAKRCILEQKCQKGQIGTLMLGTRWYKF